MKTPILGGSYVAVSTNAACNRMVNLYPELNAEGGKETGFLRKCPGLSLLATVGTGPIRGMYVFKGLIFVVSGSLLYAMGNDYIPIIIGGIANTQAVSMSDNGNQLFIAADPRAYVYDFTLNSMFDLGAYDVDFQGAKSVGYLDGYFVYIEPNTQKLWVTSILDGTQVDPLDFASVEGAPDNLVSLLIDHREVWLFGTNSVEVWYNAGAADFPLQRIQGAFIEVGCAATASPAKIDGGIFWLGTDRRGSYSVYRTNGYNSQRVSTHAVEWQINSYARVDDAVAFSYRQDGHEFYVLSFPSANITWVYDAVTQTWHERGYFNTSTSSYERHRANSHVFYDGKNIVGDYDNGKIYQLDGNTYSDDGNPIRWLRSWRALAPGTDDLKGQLHHGLRIDCEAGVGLNSGQGSDPQIMLRWSDDGGHTWSDERQASMGKIGEHYEKVNFRRLGQTKKLRDRVYEISGTDPVKVIINGASVEGVALANRKF